MKIAILISGRGSNMVALVDAVKSGEIPASEVAVVISDKRDAAGLEKARERGVDTVVAERNGRTREEHDAEIISVLNSYGVELVCLAGYMRLLSPGFIRVFPDRIVNIHPSLLPSFPGLNVQQQAIDRGVKVSGCTVHFVNEDLDAGPIILQKVVEVKDDDTAEALGVRILEKEHGAYVEAIRRIVLGQIFIEGQRTVFQKTEQEIKLIKILSIGHETSSRGKGVSLREALECSDYKRLRGSFGTSELIPLLRKHPRFMHDWLLYSEDKRTSGGFYIIEEPMGKPIGIGNLRSRKSNFFPNSSEEAVAHFVLSELDYWATYRD